MDWIWVLGGGLVGAGATWVVLSRRQQTTARALRESQRDLVLQETAERALAVSESRLRQLIDAVPAAFFLTNLEGECVLVNRHWRQLTGRADDEMLGHGWITAIHPDDVQRVTSGLADPGRAGKTFDDTYRLQRPDGSVSWVHTTAAPLTDPDGTLTGYVGFSSDITALVDARDAVKTLRGLIPICATCKRIRDDGGYWNQLEAYISSHTDAAFSHGICPTCLERTLSEDQS